MTFVRADESEDGYLVIQKHDMTAVGTVFGAFVSRPGLKVICSQYQMKSLADAELAASVCLSLRAATK